MSSTPEGKVKDQIRRIMQAAKAYAYWPVPMGLGTRTLDILGVRYGDGRFFAVEAKAPGKKPTAAQRTVIRELYQKGAAVFVLNGQPDDMRAFAEWLTNRTLGRGSNHEDMILMWNIFHDETPVDTNNESE